VPLLHSADVDVSFHEVTSFCIPYHARSRGYFLHHRNVRWRLLLYVSNVQSYPPTSSTFLHPNWMWVVFESLVFQLSCGCVVNQPVGSPPRVTESNWPTMEAAAEERASKRARVEAEEPALNPKKKRKVALFLSYLGKGYSGMQRNPGMATIEEVLEDAIWKAGGITDDNRGKFANISWMRAARTDKGVSAVGQVVSLKMIIKPDGVIERINQHLPQQIRALGFKRVTNGFDARKLCDRRRYEYVLPLFAFDSEQCREKSYYEQNGKPLQYGVTNDIEFTAELKERFNGILNQYVGTHNFHNFTQGVDAHEPQALRHILSFTVGEPFDIHGRKFVACTVLGQSFVLHQIRKMIGLALAIVRGVAPETCIEEAYRKDISVNVPLAPELGLFLVEAVFDSYNKRFGSIHENLNMNDYAESVSNFKKDFIYKHIAETEEAEKTMAVWLRSLNERNFKFTNWGNALRRRGHQKQPQNKRDSAAAKDGRDAARGEQGWDGNNEGARPEEQVLDQNGSADPSPTRLGAASTEAREPVTPCCNGPDAEGGIGCVPENLEGAPEKIDGPTEPDVGRPSGPTAMQPEAASE